MTTRRSLACTLLLVLQLATATLAGGKAEKDPSLADTVSGSDTTRGLVTFHQAPDKLWLEVPKTLLGVDLGLGVVLVRGAGDWMPRGTQLENAVVAWRRLGHRLVLVKRNTAFRADPASPLASTIAETFPDSSVFHADLQRLSDKTSPLLVDASTLFGPDLAELLPAEAGFGTSPDESTLVSVKAFPDNAVARVAFRFKRQGDAKAEPSPGPRFAGVARLPDQRFLDLLVEYHLFRLPDDGFRPRRADERIGVFEDGYKDYTDIDRRDTAFRRFAWRWDVRPSDPSLPVSPAIEPITFYVDHGVPTEWRELLREAALWWNSAFEKVGISDALKILDRPEDPEWDPADLRHSMIWWNLSDDLNFSGMAGPSLVDPRTGKVLKGAVYLNGEFPSFALHRYLVYAWWRAPTPGSEAGFSAGLAAGRAERLRTLRRNRRFCDRAASFSSQIAFARLVLLARGVLEPETPEAERFAQEAFQELVAHEVGHALGFPHNWKASLLASAEEVASGRLTGRVESGIFSTSVMDYDPIYLGPKGAPQGDYFMRELGPYDDLSVEYVYRPFPGLGPEEEARELDRIAARAEVERGLIYDSGELNEIDPTTNADDFGDDPLAFAEERLRILREEVLPRLPELVLAEGHDYNLLRQALDAAVFSVAMDYIDMAARHVGGQILFRRVASSASSPPGGPPPITPVEAARQRRALRTLDEQLFAPGSFSLSPATMSLLKADLLFDWNYPWRFASDYDLGSRIAGLYDTALGALLQPARLTRILDNERRVAEGEAFTLPELFGHLERSAFGDLVERGEIGSDRRAFQRLLTTYLARLVVAPEKGTPAEASQLAAATLRDLQRRIDAVSAEAPEGYSRAHLEDLSNRIRRTLSAGIQLEPGR